MLKLFKRKQVIELKSPATGEVIPITSVPDEVFAQKMVGDGIGIIPVEGIVVSPVEGELVQIFPTKHALGIRCNDGLEMLIHVGLDTVEMNGEGFESFVKEGDKVTIGEKLLSFDLNLVSERAKSNIIIFVITNFDTIDSMEVAKGSIIKAKDTAMSIIRK